MKLIYLLFSLLGLIFFTSCEELPPDIYEPVPFVEGVLIVDKPIEDIRVMWTQPLTDSLDYEKSLIRDATVFIKFDDQKLLLTTETTGDKGYFYPDTSVLIQPNKTYELEIILKDGTVITSSTFTPSRFNWTKQPPNILQFPKDTINYTDATDTVKISWDRVNQAFFWFIRVACLDTLEYGKYLQPPTNEPNRRIYRPFSNPERPSYRRTVTWGLLPLNEAPVVWTSFKWYGRHRISIISPDFNYLRWSLQYFRSGQYDPLLSSVNNAIGYFGSASEINSDFILIY